ncbi:hypothetical protein RQM08_09725 [Citrobacter freundii]|uniref:hypothetical protein n=1 Tax=Citrobacter freundii TaxID=546 RepID=UPI0028BD78B9|nr:hypothetical protein [Citrobacter freundii]MDT7324853.1 hypothetical protein [Citrobacter freundii]
MITEKNNVFYCDCGFSWRRGMSGSHYCEDRLRAKLAESQREFRAADATIHNLELKITDMSVQLANAESKCRELAAELSAVDKIHNEAVFITDDHYEQCPPEVQKIIRSLAVLQIPACDAFMAEVRASGVEMMAAEADQLMNEFGDDSYKVMVTADLQRFANAFAAQLRKGAAL